MLVVTVSLAYQEALVHAISACDAAITAGMQLTFAAHLWRQGLLVIFSVAVWN